MEANRERIQIMPIPRAYRNDKDAPWEADPVPECPDCDECIHSVADHTDWCEHKGTQAEVAEYWAEQHSGADIADRKEL